MVHTVSAFPVAWFLILESESGTSTENGKIFVPEFGLRSAVVKSRSITRCPVREAQH